MTGQRNLQFALANYTEQAADTGLATAGGAATLTDTLKDWPIDMWAGLRAIVEITEGTGFYQFREILSNTLDTLTVNPWTTIPDDTSRYAIRVLSIGSGPRLLPVRIYDAVLDAAGVVYSTEEEIDKYHEKMVHVRVAVNAGAPAPLNVWAEISPTGVAGTWEPLAPPMAFVVAGNNYIAWEAHSSFVRVAFQQPAWPGAGNSWDIEADLEAS